MDDFTLTIESIKVKVQKLVLRNAKLLEKVSQLEEVNRSLEKNLEKEVERNRIFEDELINAKISGIVDKAYSKQAKQKINEMLREIDKCYALLNR